MTSTPTVRAGGESARAWQAFLEEIGRKGGELRFDNGEEPVYRGHGDNRWSLLPGLLRPGHPDARVHAIESDLFFEFQAQARELPGERVGDWDVLFAMQHHGTPTRLLDWTDTLGIAVYFALADARRDATRMPCVWILNGYALNEETFDDRDLVSPRNLGWDANEGVYYDYGELLLEPEPFEWNAPVAVYPAYRNPRMIAQRGYFTMHGADLRPLSDKKWRRFSRCVELPREAFASAVQFLDMAGINEATIFPELDGLSRWLRAKYGFGT